MNPNNTQHKSFLWHLDFEPFTWHTIYGEQCPIVCISSLAQWSRHGNIQGKHSENMPKVLRTKIQLLRDYSKRKQ